MPNRIKDYRKIAGMTQEALAEAVGTSVPQISRLEKGERKLTQDWMERIGLALGISPAALLEPTVRGPDAGEVVNERAEISLLRFWRGLDEPQRDLFLKMLGATGERDDDAA